MSGANLQHLLAMILYMAAVVGIGIYFAGRANKDAESYFLGGRSLGPLMLLCLFWKRTTYQGAIAGMVAGGTMVFFWKLVLKPLGGMFGIYELLPAFVFSVIVIVAVSLLTAEPDAQIEAEFDKVKAGKGLQ